MKRILLLFAILSIGYYMLGQDISFTYDAAGNRTARSITISKSTTSDSSSESQPEPYVEQLKEHLILIYPNPVKEQLKVEINGLSDDQEVLINLYDLSGKLLFTTKTKETFNYVSFSDMMYGTYILRVYIGKEVSEWKVIKE